MADALGVKLLTVATPSLTKKLATIGVRMRDPEDLTGGVQPFVHIHNTTSQSNSAATASNQ